MCFNYYVFLIVAAGIILGCCAYTLIIICAASIYKAHTRPTHTPPTHTPPTHAPPTPPTPPTPTSTPTFSPETTFQHPTESLSCDNPVLASTRSLHLPPISDSSAVMENKTHGET